MTAPVTPSAVDGLDLARVLVEHEDRGGGWYCSCQPDGSLDVLPTTWEAHLADALATEFRRWLADEGTRERVARAIFAEEQVARHESVDDRWTSTLNDEDQNDYRELATAALAALTDTQGGSR